ncbi:hypothetical protein TW83_18400, partial [Paracoccus sp. S4493]
LALSDRVAVMFDGRIMGERLPDRTTTGELGLLMAGITETPNTPAAAGIPPQTAHDLPEGRA